jgi:hypothetical protein
MKPIQISDADDTGAEALLDTLSFAAVSTKSKRSDRHECRPEIETNGGAFASFWHPSLWECVRLLFGANVRVMVGYSWGPLRVDTISRSDDGSPVDW